MPPRARRSAVKAAATAAAQPGRHVVVLVLGDVGRSPRMQYHALSLAREDEGTRVSLVGYRGERCIPDVETHPRIRVHYVDPLAGNALRRLSFLVFAAVKIAALVLQLLALLLLRLPRPDVILVQNPPSIPTLAVAWLVAALRGSTLVIDWHNLGFSILSHSRGSDRHPLVKVARVYEKLFGRCADLHFCVTDAMRQWLRDNFGIRAHVLHDRPPGFFGPTPTDLRHELFLRLKPQLDAWDVEQRYTAATGVAVAPGEDTPFTVTAVSQEKGKKGASPELRPDGRPALVVSSTSWTEEENFGILLEALVALDRRWGGGGQEQEAQGGGGSVSGRRTPTRASRGKGKQQPMQASPPPPFLVVAVTGKGPQKQMYEARIRRLALRRVAVCTLWLEAADYPRLMGAADVGVCLHASTSGIDLPMKVLDMFGCEVPVCALGFSCLGELVRDQENGLVFHDSAELAGQLDALLRGFPRETPLLDRLRVGVRGMARWEENWRAHAAPVLGEMAAGKRKSWVLWWSVMAGMVAVALGVAVLLVQAALRRWVGSA